MGTDHLPARTQSVAEAKSALREFAARSDARTFKPIAKSLALAGAGLAIATVVLGKSKSMGRLLATGLRVAPLLLKFL